VRNGQSVIFKENEIMKAIQSKDGARAAIIDAYSASSHIFSTSNPILNSSSLLFST